MRFLSLFSGVEAASVAWIPLGWEPVAFAEVDEFPSAVLAYRFPDVPNLGDVTKIDWSEFYAEHGAVDVLVGGSPCQSFSIAGNREGLSGESGLMYEYIRAVRDLVRASGGACPRYILWENVPGALSSERGNAFGQLLAELDDIGYGLAWRVLDAQYARIPDRSAHGFFGPVAQRRRRVFLVGSLGSPGAVEILFERSCLSGNHPKGREAREALASDPAESVAVGDSAGFRWFNGSGSRSIGYVEDASPTISVSDNHVPAVLSVITANTNANGHGIAEEVTHTLDGANGQVVCMASAHYNAEVLDDLCTTQTARQFKTAPIIAAENPVVIDRAAYNQGANALYPPHIEQTNLMDALVARGPHAVCHRTAKISSAQSARGTTRESGAST